MITVGLDMSALHAKCAWVRINWDDRTYAVEARPDPGRIVELLNTEDFDVAAVDVPFGWPQEFASFIQAHAKGPVSAQAYGIGEPERFHSRERAAYRETDRVTRKRTGQHPLSVAFDRLGSTAAQWAVIEAALAGQAKKWDCKSRIAYRRGDQHIIETYPAAFLHMWGIRRNGGKPSWVDLNNLMVALDIAGPRPGGLTPIDDANHALKSSDDCRDAFVCAAIARHILADATGEPRGVDWRWPDGRRNAALQEAAQHEGWIWLGPGPTAAR